jgi:3-deoxy-D-manno-octulosonate 8-phosphate phosphatase KdsC-like HAD superfamily phosphatase
MPGTQATQTAHYETSVPGGSYAVREVIELILKAKGVWPVILAKYEAS